ncbi:MAG: crossover junction endodeoxyribonuclease RuvC [Deltaproteobacteria bacterium]|nr:crossover junction endodeoxyribonuclease RuvC [Deltaproteobacteria bacterium]
MERQGGEARRTRAFPYRVLGIDPGSRVTGYGVIELTGPGRSRYLECGVLRTSPKLPIDRRLVEIAQGLREVVEELQPQVAAIEDVFYRKNARSALLLGQARGVALLVCAEKGLEIFSYPPAFVKKTVAGQGRASKEQMQKMVTALCGLKHEPESDAADALALALCHASDDGLTRTLADVVAQGASSSSGRPGGRHSESARMRRNGRAGNGIGRKNVGRNETRGGT